MKKRTLMYVNVSEILKIPGENDTTIEKESRVNTDIDFDDRGKTYRWMADAMKEAQAKATSEKHILFYIEICINIGGITGVDRVKYISFTEITPEGFYVYPWVKQLDQPGAARGTIINFRDLAVFTDNAYAALSTHTQRAESEWNASMAYKAWAGEHAKTEYRKVVRLAKALNRAYDGEEVRKLAQALKDARAELEAKYMETHGHLAF